jgi:hypothetical protein
MVRWLRLRVLEAVGILLLMLLLLSLFVLLLLFSIMR